MTASRPLYDFGPFRLDPIERRLIRSGEPVAIAPKCFDLLVVLVENGGHLLEKEELITTLWPNQFVEESSLSFQVSSLRKILGGGVNGEHYIETVPKKGFRFVANIVEHQGSEIDPRLKHQDGVQSGEKPDDAAPAPKVVNENLAEDAASLTSGTLWSLLVCSVLVIGALVLAYEMWPRRTHVLLDPSISSKPGEERKPFSKNPEAILLYSRGSYLSNKGSVEIFDERRKGLRLYESAIEEDPELALAYVGIAEFYINGAPLLTKLAPVVRMPRARAAVLRALVLDNTLAEAHNALAELKYQYDFDWSGAEEHFKQAINLNSNVANIRLAHGWYLMCMGNFEQADAELEKAQQLDSRSLDIMRARGMLLLYERQYDKAIKYYLRMREIEPKSHRTNWYMSMAYQGKGMYAEAVEEFLEHGRTIRFLTPQEILGLREAFQTTGWQGFLRQRLVVANGKPKDFPIPPTIRAGIYALLGDTDHAFEWLEKGLAEHDPEMAKLKIEPAYDNLRSDPRFAKILQRLNLV